jgi:hypothetical protein
VASASQKTTLKAMKTLGITLFFGSFAFHFWIDQKIRNPAISGSYRYKELPAFKMCADPEDGLQAYCQHIARYNFLSGIARGITVSGFLVILFAYA